MATKHTSKATTKAEEASAPLEGMTLGAALGTGGAGNAGLIAAAPQVMVKAVGRVASTSAATAATDKLLWIALSG